MARSAICTVLDDLCGWSRRVGSESAIDCGDVRSGLVLRLLVFLFFFSNAADHQFVIIIFVWRDEVGLHSQ